MNCSHCQQVLEGLELNSSEKSREGIFGLFEHDMYKALNVQILSQDKDMKCQLSIQLESKANMLKEI